MMMPILEQSPAHHHHHGHGHQTFYHQQHIPEQNGKMQLTLMLPNGVPSVISVDANTPMMDLLVQAASLNKLNPSGYSLVVLDSNQHVIHFKANQTVGQIGSSTISLLPRETIHPNSSTKTKTQPFQITVRLQVNLPDAQKILLRVDPTLPLHEIKEQICKQKNYSHSNHYTLRSPNKLDQPLLLGLSLAEYKTNELTLIYDKQIDFDQQLNRHHLQSFDRLYRTRSESQPPKETLQEIQNEQQEIHTKQTYQLNTNRSSTLRPSHTSLHAYWNDPNFDTQSQISNSSSTTKKRRAPRPPGYISPNRIDPQIVYIQQQRAPLNTHSPSPPPRLDHHQSHESLQSETTKRKRKAPIVVTTNSIPKKDENDKKEEEQQQQNVTSNITRPGLNPPPPPTMNTIDNSRDDFHTTVNEPQLRVDSTINPTDDQRSSNLLETQTPANAKSNTPEQTNIETPSSSSSSLQNNKEQTTEVESAKVLPQQEESEQVKELPIHSMIVESSQLNAPVPKPPRQHVTKEKKSSSIGGLIRIINDHTERAEIYRNSEKPTNENMSYFRVAKSRYGKFETESRGFVNNSIAIFDSATQQQTNKNSHSSEIASNSRQQKSVPNVAQHQTKGKQAYDLLKKYEKEEQLQSNNNADYLKTTHDKDKSPTPIQLEVTERTTHITVTVESDRKQLITRVSPVPQQAPPPPTVAPKPFGKTITEYRTARRIGNGGETTSTLPSTYTNNQRSTSTGSDDRISKTSATSHESLMESIRRFGGSQNLGKK